MITADDIIALAPCWTPERVRAAVGAGVTYRQIAEDDGTSFADRRWVLTRLGVRTQKGLKAVRLWAISCAQDAVVAMEPGDAQDASLGAISAALDLVEGVGEVEHCRSAYASAAYAAYAASAASAYAAAYAAADAAYAAAAADAASAASAAAYAAAYASAYASAAATHLLHLAASLEAL